MHMTQVTQDIEVANQFSAVRAFRELVALSVHSVELRAHVDKFFDSDGILAEFEIDHARTAEIGTGDVIYFDKASQYLIDALIAARAMKADLEF
jgi:hypothetical protein